MWRIFRRKYLDFSSDFVRCPVLIFRSAYFAVPSVFLLKSFLKQDFFWRLTRNCMKLSYWVRIVRSWTFVWELFNHGLLSGPHFPVFGLNTEINYVNLRIQFKYGKIRTKKSSAVGHFSRDVFNQFICTKFSALINLENRTISCYAHTVQSYEKGFKLYESSRYILCQRFIKLGLIYEIKHHIT